MFILKIYLVGFRSTILIPEVHIGMLRSSISACIPCAKGGKATGFSFPKTNIILMVLEPFTGIVGSVATVLIRNANVTMKYSIIQKNSITIRKKIFRHLSI